MDMLDTTEHITVHRLRRFLLAPNPAEHSAVLRVQDAAGVRHQDAALLLRPGGVQQVSGSRRGERGKGSGGCRLVGRDGQRGRDGHQEERDVRAAAVDGAGEEGQCACAVVDAEQAGAGQASAGELPGRGRDSAQKGNDHGGNPLNMIVI